MALAPNIVQGLVRAIETKDLTTAAHTWRVVLYTRVLTEHFGAGHEAVERASVAAALHDIGKLDIPESILQKPGKLTPEEFEVMKTHTLLGHERLLALGEEDKLVLELVRHHHERWDGLGYPDALKGDEIAQAARYFAVVDSFDALTSVRPYRHEVGHDAAKAAVRELRANVDSRYCAVCVEAFASLYEKGKLDWILENFNDRCELPAFDGPGRAAEASARLRG
jgi:HD-GYP domain-containing protein (c-di-GMP phosphodiesterase class II)